MSATESDFDEPTYPVRYMCGHKGRLPIPVDPVTKVGVLSTHLFRECPKCEKRHAPLVGRLGLKLGQKATGPTLFDADEAARLRDEGLARADAHASQGWKDRWDAAILHLARSGVRFTADDVRELAGPPEDHPNAAGQRLRLAAKAGRIRHTGRYEPSKRAALHRHVLTVWEGTGP